MTGPLGGQQWPARSRAVARAVAGARVDTHPRRQERLVRAEGAIPEREVSDVAEIDRDSVRSS